MGIEVVTGLLIVSLLVNVVAWARLANLEPGEDCARMRETLAEIRALVSSKPYPPGKE